MIEVPVNTNQPEAEAELARAMKAFEKPTLQGIVHSAVNTASPEPAPETEIESVEPELTEEVDEGEVEGEGELEVSEGFAAEFEQTFGIKPGEAVELINELQAFRDEQRLMRDWAVSPTEYDQRMAAVREFYSSLPEDGRQQFNNVDGAQAIWKHLVDSGKAKPSKTPTTTRTSRVSKTKATQPKKELLKKSDILKMSEEEYQRNLPKITKAFAEKRVVLDA